MYMTKSLPFFIQFLIKRKYRHWKKEQILVDCQNVALFIAIMKASEQIPKRIHKVRNRDKQHENPQE